jgi:hypothetical protein
VSSCVEPGTATFSSIRCRLQVLRTDTAGADALGELQAKVAPRLEKAIERANEAGSSCAGRDTKRARRGLKQAIKQLGQYARRLRTPKARRTAPAEVREPLATEADEIRTDAAALRRTLDCSAGVP